MAEGFNAARSRLFKVANESVLHSLHYAYRDRKRRKIDMRGLWIARINAAARQNGMPYGQLMHGLKTAGVTIDRKMLADIAVKDEKAFSEMVSVAKGALKQA
jgi:large subunit ribosomal protein L20